MEIVAEASVAAKRLAAIQQVTLLAIDASTETCSVALLTQGKIDVQLEIAPKSHGIWVLPMVNALLSRHNLKLANLDGLAFGGGPGRFTGLRIAAGVVQGMALSHRLPVIKISTLAATAQAAWRQWGQRRVVVIDDARQRDFYFGCYELDAQNRMQPLQEDLLVESDTFTFSQPGNWFAVGSAWQLSLDLASRFTSPPVGVEPCCYSSAEDVATLAAPQLLAGQGSGAADALPTYLRTASSWRRMDQPPPSTGRRGG